MLKNRTPVPAPDSTTMTRALVVVMLGIVTDWLPSLGVAVRRVVGNVAPPSFDNRMSTLGALTGAAVVPATFHVTVWAELPA